MGREIRKVPPHWEHPKRKCPHEPWAGGCYDAKQHNGQCYQPLCDKDFNACIAKWEQPTWYQVYETVSDGTPVTPPFATTQELIEYLVQYGDFWDQHRGDGGWIRAYAERFVESEWSPSLVVISLPDHTEFKTPRDGA